MKTKIVFLFLLILISCGTSKVLKSKPIFRYVDLYSYGKFELGDDLEKIKHLTEVIDNKIFLKKDIFGRAESIEIIQNSAGKIKSIIFNYGTKTNLESEIKDYKSFLGIPKTNNNTATWNDGATSFELYLENAEVLSKMTDLKK